MPLPLLAGIAARKAALKLTRKARGLTRAKRLKQTAKTQDAEAPGILSLEGVAMMGTAAAFDIIPPVFVLVLDIFFGLGELLSWPLDILATMILGTWMHEAAKKLLVKSLGNF